MISRILSLLIRQERDVVLARQRARQISGLLGFESQDQTRIATAVSEIARNTFRYAVGGRIEFKIGGSTAPQVLLIEVGDEGPGIANLQDILDGRYRSTTGMGLGIIGARRLMDQFDIGSSASGTTITMAKLLPAAAAQVTAARLAEIGRVLAAARPQEPFEEIQQQNQELMQSLETLAKKQQELLALNQELQDTNRGVVALYAELDEKADHLRRADELKSRFLSNMTHEFRTPVNSIQALCRMLLDRSDGELTAEQERQIGYIRTAAEALSDLVNDLLDLAKVEAGKTEVRPVEFEVRDLFGVLRGMLRPLLVSDQVNLVFDEPDANLPTLYTDEAKVSQILRNFISNALKFTERGEVRVRADRASGDHLAVAFAVTDTGIGIAGEDLETIFQEFTQIDSPVQRRVRGTGLGLPLCNKLAQLLGGTVSVASELDIGSTFTATIPAIYPLSPKLERNWEVDPQQVPVLVVEDAADVVLTYEKYLRGTDFQVLAASDLREARQAMLAFRPRAIILDIMLRGEAAWEFLAELKRRSTTRTIPVIVATSVEDRGKGVALGADAYWVKPFSRETLRQTLTELTTASPSKRVLIIDDEEISRYLLRQQLGSSSYTVSEAADGESGLDAARREHPDLICLDLVMPGIDGYQVLEQLKASPETKQIPVLVFTSKTLSDRERDRLLEHAVAIRSKANLPDSVLPAVEDALATLRGPG
ncbi:MAG TPA: ATP-binding protein [Terriglobales bacterium]|nr:ATP-binding protein [Terriglobales bacterium]